MSVRVELRPLGVVLQVSEGTPLQDLLFAQGVEFPCGGRGRCKGCRVKVLEGTLSVTPEDTRLLSAADLAQGWRLACRARATGDLKLELAQWEASILTDDSPIAFQPREGLGVAVDLGTTTLVVQLLDLETGNVLGVRTALNPQAQYGADIMSRVDFAMGGGEGTLRQVIRSQLGQLVSDLVRSCPEAARPIADVVVVGNTVMHHLFSGLSVAPLAHVPFLPEHIGLQQFTAGDLGWELPVSGAAVGRGETPVKFLPCLGGFVGSDILAGILATRLPESEPLVALIDLGTNGELVVGNRQRMLCTSTAAGPAFEGARISMGMRAATGAISEVSRVDGQLHCRVLGQVVPRGLCGSGLVDAVAVGLDSGVILPSGRLVKGVAWPLAGPVSLTQKDVRELQLAKGAIAAGLRILLQQWGAASGQLERIYLAGAFGNYISRASARRIGLIGFPPEKVEPAGNTALRGAKLALFHLAQEDGAYEPLRRRIEYVCLNDDPSFEEVFVDEMGFPG